MENGLNLLERIMIVVAIFFIGIMLGRFSHSPSNTQTNLTERTINDHITFVREPWSGLCFVYIDAPQRAALAHIPCEAIKEDMGPIPTIPVYQYE